MLNEISKPYFEKFYHLSYTNPNNTRSDISEQMATNAFCLSP